MNYFYEKIFFGSLNLLGAAIAATGAILSEGDARWIYVTLAVGIMVSTCMALMTRNEESMKVVAGRFLFAVICTVFGTRILSHYVTTLSPMHEDVLFLAAVAGAVNVISFTMGYGLIRSLDDQRLSLGKWLKELLITILTKK